MINSLLIDDLVRAALLEDLGRAGDLTSQATLPDHATANVAIISRETGILAGLPFAERAFAHVDPAIRFTPHLQDGAALNPGQVVAEISGPARAVLSGERVGLNFMGRLSGIASATASFAAETAGFPAKITCTRKTTPLLRAAEKYAVRCGGGSNHRYGLDDAILIKDNHIAINGSVAATIAAARAYAGHLVKIEIEVDTLAQYREALDAQPDVILLDNMPPAMMAEAVAIKNEYSSSVILEASGNVVRARVAAIAATGVDYISSGWITHSAPVLDLGLDVTLKA